MIYFYSGTPGSGKSLQVAKEIVLKLTIKKENVISNIKINLDGVRNASLFKPKNMGRFYYLSNEFFSIDFLYKYAEKFHQRGKEGQTLLVIDEAQMLFSPTVIKIRQQDDSKYRAKWLEFFTQHRKLGFNIILVSPFDKLIDAQIRCCLEYNVIHRKVNNYKIGWLLGLFHISVFTSIHYWYGANQRIGCEFFMYRKKYSKIYDSYQIFGKSVQTKKIS